MKKQYIINADGFYDPLLEMMRHMVEHGFLVEGNPIAVGLGLFEVVEGIGGL